MGACAQANQQEAKHPGWKKAGRRASRKWKRQHDIDPKTHMKDLTPEQRVSACVLSCQQCVCRVCVDVFTLNPLFLCTQLHKYTQCPDFLIS